MSKLKQYKMFINGEWVDSESKKTFETLNPEHNEPWAVVPEASAKDVDNAVKAAQKAFEGEWPKLLPRERAKYLRAIGSQLRENAEMLGEIETIDTGKLYRETKKQAVYIAEYYDYYAGLADKVEGTVLPIDKPNVQAITTRIPIGVIAAIIPWNSQMFLTATKVAPALAMGNTVVIKSSELAPAVLFEFAKLIEKTGIPKGVVNVITGFGDPCGKSLTTHNLVEKVAFTGGPETARHIIRNSAENLSEVSLELGGKNPLVVMPSADLDNAVEGAYWGAFGTAGQRCTSLGNLIIHESIYDAFMEKFMIKVNNTRIGDSLHHENVLYGPMLSEKYASDFLKALEMPERDGAKKIHGNGRISGDNKPTNFQGDPDTGVFMWPHVYVDVEESMECFHEEMFGPVVTVVKAKDFDHALHLANASPYGLSSAIYTNDRMEAYQFKTGIKAGMTSINNSTSGAEAHLPFGGVKGSGNGTRESGIWVIEAYTYWHAVNDELSGKLQLGCR